MGRCQQFHWGRGCDNPSNPHFWLLLASRGRIKVDDPVGAKERRRTGGGETFRLLDLSQPAEVSDPALPTCEPLSWHSSKSQALAGCRVVLSGLLEGCACWEGSTTPRSQRGQVRKASRARGPRSFLGQRRGGPPLAPLALCHRVFELTGEKRGGDTFEATGTVTAGTVLEGLAATLCLQGHFRIFAICSHVALQCVNLGSEQMGFSGSRFPPFSDVGVFPLTVVYRRGGRDALFATDSSRISTPDSSSFEVCCNGSTRSEVTKELCSERHCQP